MRGGWRPLRGEGLVGGKIAAALAARGRVAVTAPAFRFGSAPRLIPRSTPSAGPGCAFRSAIPRSSCGRRSASQLCDIHRYGRAFCANVGGSACRLDILIGVVTERSERHDTERAPSIPLVALRNSLVGLRRERRGIRDGHRDRRDMSAEVSASTTPRSTGVLCTAPSPVSRGADTVCAVPVTEKRAVQPRYCGRRRRRPRAHSSSNTPLTIVSMSASSTSS